MNILIIEDEAPAAKHIKRLIGKIKPEAMVLGPIESIGKAVEWFQSNSKPDLVLCDIQLADGLSFKIFDQVSVEAPLIFITAYDQFAIRAFKLNSIDYLLKPVDPEELKHAMQQVEKRQASSISAETIQALLQSTQKKYKSRFMVKLGEVIKSIKTEEVLYIYSQDKATYLHTVAKKNYIVDYALSDLEEVLNPRKFFRLNRQYIASIEAIQDVLIYSNSRLKITLAQCDDDSILVSRNRVDDFKRWMDDNIPES
ncbi:LytR/AlgR family response regulator transcription factor [Gracilimonas mengyeensis]|uniref:Two component transcriptional regulator, LytTR family n=1 Tax=Gracilimonas mengyeensis TaxID=1302730 RepID=A0A521D8N1_9BACT|nr:LytTR family DNA-binding domain-containing protein [Gracilimonas mengyeensis]SMO67965.1 two component transcriptional regulator, LytTR family [Gracilimonas mengyeensis]